MRLMVWSRIGTRARRWALSGAHRSMAMCATQRITIGVACTERSLRPLALTRRRAVRPALPSVIRPLTPAVCRGRVTHGWALDSIKRMSDVTRLLEQIAHGDAAAEGQLFPLVYEELRRLASAHLAREKPGHTLQATALVHEAFVRLVGAHAASD